MTNPRRLIVMRHAKAEPFASTDHSRRLTDRGAASARDAGVHLVAHGLVPDYAVVSSSARTVATWDAVAEGSSADAEVSVDDAVYTGSADVALESLRAAPEQARTLIFVGHNPTAAYLVHMLDDSEGDPDALTRLMQDFPPGAVATFEVAGQWAALGPESGRLVDYYVGQG
ncbi:MAG: SixA phosphatase family protein [Nocardioidaceae bacterium]